MAAPSNRTKWASTLGLAFPPGLVLPDPSEATFPSTPELEQLGFSYALEVAAAAPVGVVAPTKVDSFLWQVPKGGKRAYGRGVAVFPTARSRGTLVYGGLEIHAVGVSALPRLVSRGLLGALGVPEPIAAYGIMGFPVPISRARGDVESEDDILALLAAYMMGR